MAHGDFRAISPSTRAGWKTLLAEEGSVDFAGSTRRPHGSLNLRRAGFRAYPSRWIRTRGHSGTPTLISTWCISTRRTKRSGKSSPPRPCQ